MFAKTANSNGLLTDGRVTMKTQKSTGLMNDLTMAGRGLLMGGADIIPGVSGGTVALILGIYQRLVTAISRFDLLFLHHLRQGRFAEAARHVDLRFLVALGCGILTGIVSLASFMNYLITTSSTRPLTLAAFFGLILASGILVGKMVEGWSPPAIGMCALGGSLAFILTGLNPLHAEPSALYIFFCGMIGICAMILPGISGAFILLLLGMYVYVTDALKAIKGLPSGEFTWQHFETIALFSLGCVVGLLTFSKILRWLLASHESLTMATLCGFMLGSLRKIWPFQNDLTPDQAEFKLKIFDNVWPKSAGELALVTAIAVAAAILVFMLDWCSRGSEHVPPLSEETT